MGRRKIEIKAIKDDRNRSVTFLKRKGGLFKKAHELSVLCSVDVTVIIFGHNKKLYEFSSGDIQETLGRYQYYGQPHEHKGPADFLGKGALDDDDEDDSPAEDGKPQLAQTAAQQPTFQHVKQPPPSVSPPLDGPHAAPLHPPSRPSSRNHVQRMAMQQQQQHHHQQHQQHQQHQHSTPPPQQQPVAANAQNPQNGFAYIQNYPQHQHQQQQQQQQQQSRPFHYAHGHPHPPLPPPPHQPMAQQYMQDNRRQSMPPAFQEQQQPQPPQQQHTHIKIDRSQSPPPPKRLNTKSRSIFTPIDDPSSVLAQHFPFGPPVESPKKDHLQHRPPPPPPQPHHHPQQQQQQQRRQQPVPPPQHRTHSTSSIPTPSSVRSGGGRPRLTVQIPSETSDAGSAGSSPATTTNPITAPTAAAAAAATANTTKPETGHSAVVLPPPSPSASALLSAGAHGPPNPFARPPPPSSSNNNNSNNNGNGNGNGSNGNHGSNIDTPISALPSRFVSDTLLPSPSSFYPEWGFGRSGPDSNMLPSPLTFSTPILQNPSQPFGGLGTTSTNNTSNNNNNDRDADGVRKRKDPEPGAVDAAVDKRLKVE